MFNLVFRWFILWLVQLPLLIINYVFAPIIILFAKNGHLPDWLKWFETYDNDLYGGNDWKLMHPNYKSYWCQVLWIWRNPIGTFSYVVAGVIPQGPFNITGDRQTTNTPNGHSGKVFVEGKNCFLWYYIRQWGSSDKCIRIALGWKLFYLLDDPNNTSKKVMQLVFAPNPYMHFDNTKK
jgi:hypothetical protein